MKKFELEHSYLKTTADFRKIHDHPLNNSRTKMQFSFPHSNRFSKFPETHQLDLPFYNVIDVDLKKTKRTFSLGKKLKMDFAKPEKNVPAPNAYYPKNLTIRKDSGKGFSFGIARELIPQQGIFHNIATEKTKPGPGKYTPQLPKSGISTTFKIKLDTHNDENVNIGPGKYEIQSTVQPTQKLINSKYKSAKSTKFPPVNKQTLNNDNILTNSKGQNCNENGLVCDLTHQMNKTGVYKNSKYHNSLCRSFSKSKKGKLPKHLETPGPGTYVMPSEFGFYASSKFV